MEELKTTFVIDGDEYEELLRAEFERDTILAALKRSVNDRYGLRFDEDELVPVLSALGYDVDAWVAAKHEQANKTEDADE